MQQPNQAKFFNINGIACQRAARTSVAFVSFARQVQILVSFFAQ